MGDLSVSTSQINKFFKKQEMRIFHGSFEDSFVCPECILYISMHVFIILKGA